jgi:hypothetical protein
MRTVTGALVLRFRQPLMPCALLFRKGRVDLSPAGFDRQGFEMSDEGVP